MNVRCSIDPADEMSPSGRSLVIGKDKITYQKVHRHLYQELSRLTIVVAHCLVSKAQIPYGTMSLHVKDELPGFLHLNTRCRPF